MFKVRADYSETLEINADFDTVRDFFSDTANYIDLMPDIASIREDSKGIVYWNIVAEVPFVGSFTQKFAVGEGENTAERVEWSPLEGEDKNLMRYSAELMPKGANKTTVQYSQNIELRRNSASELHFLAGLAGESVISTEVSKGIAEMVEVFLSRARECLES